MVIILFHNFITNFNERLNTLRMITGMSPVSTPKFISVKAWDANIDHQDFSILFLSKNFMFFQQKLCSSYIYRRNLPIYRLFGSRKYAQENKISIKFLIRFLVFLIASFSLLSYQQNLNCMLMIATKERMTLPQFSIWF